MKQRVEQREAETDETKTEVHTRVEQGELHRTTVSGPEEHREQSEMKQSRKDVRFSKKEKRK